MSGLPAVFVTLTTPHLTFDQSSHILCGSDAAQHSKISNLARIHRLSARLTPIIECLEPSLIPLWANDQRGTWLDSETHTGERLSKYCHGLVET